MYSSHSISYELIEGVPVISLEGDMTSESDRDMMRMYQLVKIKHAARYIIINFDKTKYINSAGIATLINMIQNLGELNGKILFVSLSDHFQKIMDIVGISDFVDVYSTEADAVIALKESRKIKK